MATLTGYKRDSESLYVDKDADAVLNYTFDYTNWLASGETITVSTWTVDAIAGDSDPVTVNASVIVSGSKKVQIVVGGGTVGNIYSLRNTITTQDANTEVKFFRIVVQPRSF
tara:strand:- start:321 stop:656 length:336 start_codon:yes stop_codon:yes gene_type:complete